MDTGNQLRQLDELPQPKPKVEKAPKPKREPKPVNVKKVKQEKVRRFDEEDFEEDSYQVPEDLRYLISDRGFD